MLSSQRNIISLFLFYLFFTITVIPLPVSPLPLTLLTRAADGNSPTPGSARMDGKVIFDIVFDISRPTVS
jgi:hypothetical protein